MPSHKLSVQVAEQPSGTAVGVVTVIASGLNGVALKWPSMRPQCTAKLMIPLWSVGTHPCRFALDMLAKEENFGRIELLLIRNDDDTV